MLVTCDISGLQNRHLPRAHGYHGNYHRKICPPREPSFRKYWFAFLTDELASISTFPVVEPKPTGSIHFAMLYFSLVISDMLLSNQSYYTFLSSHPHRILCSQILYHNGPLLSEETCIIPA